MPISNNTFLTLEEMTENAQYIFDTFTGRGWSANAICGMLGNMQTESTINPGLWQDRQQGNMSGGFGLVQWTPASKFTTWADSRGYTWGDINGQIERIQEEVNTNTQWIATSAFPMSFYEFTQSTDTPYNLAMAFIANYERPENPNQPIRGEQAEYWASVLSFTFTPRLNSDGMQGNPWYYANNPFYQAGFGLPNCTCYAWGRRGEITNVAPTLSTRNADTWWDYNQQSGAYPSGQTPRLGAIMCWSYTGSHASQGGHVSIVEEITGDSVNTSNSAYGGAYFYMKTLSSSNGYEWASYTNFQGFIYLKESPIPPKPIKKTSLPLMYYLRKI